MRLDLELEFGKQEGKRLDSTKDKQLAAMLALAQSGNREAYLAFLTEVAALVRGYLSRRMASAEAVEDVLQETLVAVHQARHTWSPGRPVGPWLYAITDRRMVDFLRRARRIERNEVGMSEEAEGLAESPQEPQSDPRGDLLHEALHRLPLAQRRVIQMLKIEDLSVKEVAAHTGMSESSVKVTAFRGYRSLRRLLGVESQSKQAI